MYQSSNSPYGNIITNALRKSVYNVPNQDNGMIPPAGYLFLIDNDGSYLYDNDGAFLVAPI